MCRSVLCVVHSRMCIHWLVHQINHWPCLLGRRTEREGLDDIQRKSLSMKSFRFVYSFCGEHCTVQESKHWKKLVPTLCLSEGLKADSLSVGPVYRSVHGDLNNWGPLRHTFLSSLPMVHVLTVVDGWNARPQWPRSSPTPQQSLENRI